MKVKMFKHFVKKNHTIINYLLLIFLAASAILAIFTWLQPATVTQNNENTLTIQSTYDYKTTITANSLFPEGGTVDTGNTIFKNITQAIPVTLDTVINFKEPVLAEGSHEIQLLLKAGEYWERTFPLQEKRSFKNEGTEIAVMKEKVSIDLDMIKEFIAEVEKDLSIRPEFYTLEVMPNLAGTVSRDGMVQEIQQADNLKFQIYFEEVLLASDTSFTSSYPYSETMTYTNTLHLFGLGISITLLRNICTAAAAFFLLAILLMNKEGLISRMNRSSSESVKIERKFGDRLIPVSQEMQTEGKNIISFDSFKSLIQLADAKDLPVFQFKDTPLHTVHYFVIERDYIYQLEVHEATFTRTRIQKRNKKKETESDSPYAVD